MSEQTGNSNIDDTIDYNPLLLRSIVKDVDAAKTHLNSHVTIKEEVMTLDMNTVRYILKNRIETSITSSLS